MSKTPNYDAKVKTILNATTPGERVCAVLGTKWMMDEGEIAMYRTYNVPPSKYAPDTRMKLIMGNFVVFDVWYNKHADTGAPIITNTHPATGIRVLPDEEWFQQDFTSHAINLDLETPFFDQLYRLRVSVPLAASYNYVSAENSIAFISLGDQDSYFVLASKSKRCCYAMNAHDAEDSAELATVRMIRSSYHLAHCERMYECCFAQESYDCLKSDFLFDCRNCENCFGATNKRNEKYVWMNEQLSKEEWEKRRAEVDLSTWSGRQTWEASFRDLMKQAVWPENFNIQVENVTGDYVTKSHNIVDGYFVWEGSHDLDHTAFAYGTASEHCSYVTGLFSSSRCYYGIGTGDSSDVRFSLSITSRCHEVEYSNSCYDCEYCFGCFGLQKKKYCILNKQYTEEEYWQRVDALKCAMLDRGEYGDLPSLKFSTQRWETSGAPIVYGATKEECMKLGALDFEPGADGAEGPAVDASLVNSIDEIPDRADESLAGKPFLDPVSGRRFAYLKPELKLHEKLGVAPPRMHPTRRINELYAEMNYAVFEDIPCVKCAKPIRVAKNRHYPDRLIYCKECYLCYLEAQS